jgi:hypothetical protein
MPCTVLFTTCIVCCCCACCALLQQHWNLHKAHCAKLSPQLVLAALVDMLPRAANTRPMLAAKHRCART